MWKPKTKIVEEKLTLKETETPSISETRSDTELTDHIAAVSEHAEPPKLESGGTPQTTSYKKPDLGARYEVLEFIGAGGMGSVWKVFDKELNGYFAVKVLLPALVADDVSLKRFQKEAELASELNHPNIVAIYGPGSDLEGNPTIIMRLVAGESLEEILKREGKLSEERATDIAQQICEALVYSHSKGIVHRDIKPSNIIISKTESGADLVQLVDFGIARCVYEQKTATMAITQAVDMLGSPLYMSPEQLLGQEVTEASDMYSFGCVFYEMLTGKPPFYDENPVKVVLMHISENSDLLPLPEKLRFTLESMLQKTPGIRFSAKYHAEFLKEPELSTISEMSSAARNYAGYWQSFSLLLLFQASLTMLPLPQGILMQLFMPGIMMGCLLQSSITRKRISALRSGSEEFCWLVVAFTAIYFTIFLNPPFFPPFVPISYALVWICLMSWKTFRYWIFKSVKTFSFDHLIQRDPLLGQKQGSKILNILSIFIWILFAQVIAMLTTPLSGLVVFGIQYGVTPFSLDSAYQNDFKYWFLGVLAFAVFLVPVSKIFPKRKIAFAVGVISFLVFSYQNLSSHRFSIFNSNAELSQYFPSTQARVLADIAKEPADKAHMKDLETATQLLNQDPSTAKDRLEIANKVANYSGYSTYNGKIFANIVRMELDPDLQNNWASAAQKWDNTYSALKSNSELYTYEKEISFRKAIRRAEYRLFTIAIKNKDSERAKSIIDRWKVIYGENTRTVKDAQQQLEKATASSPTKSN